MNSASEFLLWFPFYFASLGLFVLGLLSLISGWPFLSKKYKSRANIDGQTFRLASAGIGAALFQVSYCNCLTFVVGKDGFCVQPIWVFRVFSPKLFIPWESVRSIRKISYWFFSVQQTELKESWVTFQVLGSLGSAMVSAWSDRSGNARLGRSPG